VSRAAVRAKLLLGECAHLEEASRPSNNHVDTPLRYVDIDFSGKKINKKENRKTHSPRKFVAAAAAPRGETITTTLLPVYNV